MEAHLESCPFNPDNKQNEDEELQMDGMGYSELMSQFRSVIQDFACPFCGTTIKSVTQQSYDAHVEMCLSIHTNNQMGGSGNNEAQNTGMNTLNHGSQPQSGPYPNWLRCPGCPNTAERYPNIEELRLHVQVAGHSEVEHRSERPWACSECNARYEKVKILERHIRAHRDALEKYRCEECEARFGYKSLGST